MDLSNYRCRLKALKQDQIPLIQNTDITINNNIVNIKADAQLTTTSGVVLIELQFIDKTTGEKKSTFNLNIKVIASVLEVDRTISVATITLLQELDNKLDEIEDIGDVLDKAVLVKADLESEIIAGNTSKSNLDSSISIASTTKISLENLNITSNNTKIGLDTSIINANNSKTDLETATANAETKKQEVVEECVVADQKIATMQSFGDVTQLTQNVTALKTEVETARNGEVSLDVRLDKNDILVAGHTTQLSDKVNKTSIVNNLSATVSGSVLDATQGKILNDAITTINNVFFGNDSAVLTNCNNAPYGISFADSINSGTLNTPNNASPYTIFTLGKKALNAYYVQQFAIPLYGGVIYFRVKNSGTWFAWTAIN